MAAVHPSRKNTQLSKEARQLFITQASAALGGLVEVIRARFDEIESKVIMTGDGHALRDARLEFERLQVKWVNTTGQAWRAALIAPTESTRVKIDVAALSLIGDDVMENRIHAARLSTTVQEKAALKVNSVRARILFLDGTQEFASHDVLRPEALVQILLNQWSLAGLSRAGWQYVREAASAGLVQSLAEAFDRVDKFLVESGVEPRASDGLVVRRGADAPRAPAPRAERSRPSDSLNQSLPGAGGPAEPYSAGAWSPRGTDGSSGGYGAGGRVDGGGGVGGAAQAPSLGSSGAARQAMAEETRLLTVGSPLARARQRAQGVMGQLRRMLTGRVPGYGDTRSAHPSPELAMAMSGVAATEIFDIPVGVQMPVVSADVARVAVALRARSTELKKKASTESERATIEIVALMFQSILSEDRIPAAVRVWFARLQMPVLRVALAEPEFFGNLQHPARLLIDRLGSCVLGFDDGGVDALALETEIKRIVQVIEQYPESGSRVFQLVYGEFLKFLEKFLTTKGKTQRLVTVAQQVEEKETWAVRYTIEMRKLLGNAALGDEVRTFLFKVWTEVLAVTAIKGTGSDADLQAYRKVAADLVWAAGAKANRAERARVIADLPRLLLRLRQGMAQIGIVGDAQEAQIKKLGDALADGFLAKKDLIPSPQIAQMVEHMAELEEFVGDGGEHDLPLDKDSIELMLGIDASSIEIVVDGGSKASAGIVAWAQALQLGDWFLLDHNGRTSQVQYSWRSERRQLHLFTARDGHSVLIQARRLASYLQAGLLVPLEEEALTVRATRDALAKIEANPERLLVTA